MSDRTPIAPIPELKPRSSSIPGPPPRKVKSTSAANEATTSAEPAASDRKLETKRPKATKPAPAPSVDSPIRPISLSVPSPLLERFKAFAKRTSTTNADVMMDAIGAHFDELGDLVAEQAPTIRNDGLFVRRATNAGTVVLSTLSIRMAAENVMVLDRLVESTGAASRSQLCVVALEAYLDR